MGARKFATAGDPASMTGVTDTARRGTPPEWPMIAARMITVLDHGPVRELSLSRPPVNALDPALMQAIRARLREARQDGCRAIVLSGRAGCFSAGLDVPLKNVRQKVLDISPHRSNAATDHDIVVKCWFGSWNRLLLRNADAAHCATRTSDTDRGIHCLFKADAFQH